MLYEPETHHVVYSYDTFDNMTEIVRGDGMKYVLAYNQFHNLESIGINGKPEQLIKYTYKNGNGRLKAMTYANGDTMKATYNSIGQMVAEAWFDKNNVEKARYKYVYDGQGNIVRSIDITGKKEYNYEYEEGRIIRATECDIELSGEIITSKVVVNTIKYYYNSEGNMTKKVITSKEGTAHTVYYENTDNNTVVKFDVPAPTETDSNNQQTITSHSKTDSFGRKVFDELQLGTGFVSRQFGYHAGEVTAKHVASQKLKSSPTTQLVSQIVLSDGRTLTYEYDDEERIISVADSFEGTTTYTYDALGQLLTEKVTKGDETNVVNSMEYDNYGNITKKNGVVYVYGDSKWKDLLTSYNGQTITYDAQGNPLTYLDHTLTWEKGRQLKKLVKSDGTVIDYTYNANGIRTSKTVGGVTHTYTLEGTKILREVWDGNTLIPLYDNEESVCGIIYNNTPYYFLKNLQGDVIAIVDKNAQTVARYSYDAWGKIVFVVDAQGKEITSTSHIAHINPYRYRSYYYDTEIAKYYLQSRYYDPNIGRFVNGDECAIVAMSVETIPEQNLFQYAINSPIKNIDCNGYSANAVYYVSYSLATKMVALAAAGKSLLIALKSLLTMLWNVFVVVGLLLVVIAAIVLVCKSINRIYNDIKSRVDEKLKEHYKKYDKKICVYVLTRKNNPLKSIFYVGRTKNIIARFSKHKSPSSKYYKGDFYMFVIYACTSEVQSRIVEQTVLSACLVGELTQIIFGQAPSNKIRGIAKNKSWKVINDLKKNNEKELKDTLSLLHCKSESDLLYNMNQ